MDGLTRARVVVDVASLAHAIGAARARTQRRRPEFVHPELETLRLLLASKGFEVISFSVAVPVAPTVIRGGSPRPRNHAWAVQRSREWLDAQRARAAVPIAVLPGGHDGHGEVGVDAVLAAGALLAGSPDGSGADASAVVVVTQDTDLAHLPECAAPRRLVLAGRFARTVVRQLRRTGVPHVALSADDVAALDRPLAADFAPLRFPAATVEPGPTPRTVADPPDAPHVVIADPYGLSQAAVCAVGSAGLPTVAAIRSLVASLGLRPDAPVLAAVPDVVEYRQLQGESRRLFRSRLRAWRHRDAQLDALALELADDGDDTTRVTRGPLHPARLRLRPGRSARLEATRSAKQLATRMVTDTVLVLTRRPNARVVLLTDHPDVVWFHSVMDQLGLDPGRVTRIGVHAQPVLPPSRDRFSPAPFVVLTDDQVSRLVDRATRATAPDEPGTPASGPDGPYGLREMRTRLTDAFLQPDLEWQVVGLDPEADGVRISPLHDPLLEVVLAGSAGADLDVGDRLTLGPDVAARLGMPEDSACSSPTPFVSGSFDPLGVEATLAATVVGRSSSSVSVDVDGDGQADAAVPVGHDVQPVRAGSPARLARRRSTGELVLTTLDGTDRADEPEILTVTAVHGADRIEVAGPTGRRGRLLPPPGMDRIELRVGDSVFGVPTTVGEPRNWIAMSSRLVDEAFLNAPSGDPTALVAVGPSATNDTKVGIP